PELADVLVRGDDGVDQPAVAALDLADMHVEDRRAVAVELDRADRAVGDPGLAQAVAQRLRIGCVTLERIERVLEEKPGGIGARRAAAGIMAIGDADRLGEAIIGGALQSGSVPASGDDPERFVAHDAQNALIGAAGVTKQRDLAVQSLVRVLLQETQGIDAVVADINRIEVALELREEGAVVGGADRRPELLHDLAAIVLEGALEAGGALVAIGEIVGDGGDALVT